MRLSDVSNTSSRKLLPINESEPSTGDSNIYQPQLINIEINSTLLNYLKRLIINEYHNSSTVYFILFLYG